MASPKAPDCETNPILPAMGVSAAKEAFHGDTFFGIQDPHAVRTDDTDARFPCHLENFVFSLESFCPDLAKACRDDHHTLHALLGAGLHDFEHVKSRNNENRQIDWIRNLFQASPCLDRQDGIRLRIDGINRSFEPPANKIAHNFVPDAMPTSRGSDHGDRPRAKEAIQVRFALAHVQLHSASILTRLRVMKSACLELSRSHSGPPSPRADNHCVGSHNSSPKSHLSRFSHKAIHVMMARTFLALREAPS